MPGRQVDAPHLPQHAQWGECPFGARQEGDAWHVASRAEDEEPPSLLPVLVDRNGRSIAVT